MLIWASSHILTHQQIYLLIYVLTTSGTQYTVNKTYEKARLKNRSRQPNYRQKHIIVIRQESAVENCREKNSG